MRKRRSLHIVVCLLTFLFFAGYSAADELIGITWCGKHEKQKNKKAKYKNKLIKPGPSELISFSPETGIITRKFLQLDKKECFRGLAYDSKNKMLYALSQGNWNLYAIDPTNLQTELIGKLDIKALPLSKNTWGKDIGGLTYDPGSDIFYASVSHWSSNQTNILSELVTFDPRIPARGKRIGKNKKRMIEAKSVGIITYGYVSSVSFNEDDGQIYALAVNKSSSWDSPYVSSLVRINPENANMKTLFETKLKSDKIHTILGLAKKPAQKIAKKSDENIFYTWVNLTSHIYAKVDVNKKTVIPFIGSDGKPASSDPIGVNSDAMLYKNFKIGHSK